MDTPDERRAASGCRSILVHLDGGVHAASRLAWARALGARLGARVEALYATVPGPPDIETQHQRQARLTFDAAASTPGWPLALRTSDAQGGLSALFHAALTADLVVVGQRDPMDAKAFDLPADLAERLARDTGCATALVPWRAGRPLDRLEGALVAWRPDRVSAVALRGALPLLGLARRIHLVTWSADAASRVQDQQQVVDYLRLHGLHAIERHEGPPPDDAGTALLTLAAAVEADLLVMGCYGHSPGRELLFGGATATVLQHMHLPVLTAH
ncbi:MAG: universal stress protein [Pseudomonadota bacterium]|uniref:Universal stress protein n=1 Tax=Caldimonas aquatica TaxID=376175 RepID=A0ABY6MQ56_9BURK|nr:universal stress protein [Schlegelella aquatica]UZD53587.1 universal stress protein [Schlegelella aquatica]